MIIKKFHSYSELINKIETIENRINNININKIEDYIKNNWYIFKNKIDSLTIWVFNLFYSFYEKWDSDFVSMKIKWGQRNLIDNIKTYLDLRTIYDSEGYAELKNRYDIINVIPFSFKKDTDDNYYKVNHFLINNYMYYQKTDIENTEFFYNNYYITNGYEFNTVPILIPMSYNTKHKDLLYKDISNTCLNYVSEYLLYYKYIEIGYLFRNSFQPFSSFSLNGIDFTWDTTNNKYTSSNPNITIKGKKIKVKDIVDNSNVANDKYLVRDITGDKYYLKNNYNSLNTNFNFEILFLKNIEVLTSTNYDNYYLIIKGYISDDIS